jgi:CTP synthase (UTP-ammonia lyase)
MNKYKVAILGNMNADYEPHYTMNKCFMDFRETVDFNFEWVPTEALEDNAASILENYQGIVAGSGPYKSKAGVINGIRYARKNNIPFLGTCSGFGYAVLEFGQSIFNIDIVYHPYEKADLSPGETFLQQLIHCSTGMHTISFNPVEGTLTETTYNHAAIICEESHCVYGVNREMIDAFANEGLIVSGMDDEGEPKIMEYNRNDFFVITLFLPQLKSDRQNPHPLLSAFFKAVERQEKICQKQNDVAKFKV